MEKKSNLINIIIAVVFLIGAVIAIPSIFIASLLLGAVIREVMIGLIFAFSVIGSSFGTSYYIIRSISQKTVIYTKKGKEIKVKNYIFLAVGIHLVVYLMALGFTGLIYIPWVINIIISVISSFLYQPYTEKIDSNSNNS